MKNLNLLSRQALHTKNLEFFHPVNKKFMNFDSDLPADFKKLLNLLKRLAPKMTIRFIKKIILFPMLSCLLYNRIF